MNVSIIKYHSLKLLIILIGLFFFSCSSSESAGLDYTISTAHTSEKSLSHFENLEFQETQNLDLGFYSGRAWIKIQFKNSETPQEIVILCNDLINQNYRIFTLSEDNKLENSFHKKEDIHKNDHRTFNFSKPNFLIKFSPKEEKTVIITTHSDGRILQANPEIISLNAFNTLKNQTLIFDAIFYGIILVLLIINLFYSRFVTSNNNIYFFYGAYIVFGCIMYLFVEGRLYGLGLSHHFIDHLMFLSIRLWILSNVLFTLKFLETKSTNPKFRKFILLMLILTLGLPTLYQFLFPNSSIPNLHMLENLLGFIWIILCLILVGIAFKKRKQKSTYYLISYSIFLIFVGLGLLDSHATMLPGDPFSYFKIGTIFEFIGFTYFIAILVKNKLMDTQSLENELQHQNLTLQKLNQSLQSKNNFSNAIKLVENNLSTENDWESFKEKFESLNPNYLSNLLNSHPNLSKSEIRLIILIKIDYSQKEMAEILNVVPDSIKKARSRLRKKLGLSADQKLNAYLDTF